MEQQEIIEILEDNDPIGDLRRALNQEIIEKEKFHKITNVLKVVPEFLDIAEKRSK